MLQIHFGIPCLLWLLSVNLCHHLHFHKWKSSRAKAIWLKVKIPTAVDTPQHKVQAETSLSIGIGLRFFP